jgi:hypothetical protein
MNWWLEIVCMMFEIDQVLNAGLYRETEKDFGASWVRPGSIEVSHAGKAARRD